MLWPCAITDIGHHAGYPIDDIASTKKRDPAIEVGHFIVYRVPDLNSMTFHELLVARLAYISDLCPIVTWPEPEVASANVR